MATYSKPTPKTNVGEIFVKQMIALKQHCRDEEQAILNLANSQWYRPDGWASSWLDIQSYHTPFNRTQQEEEFMQSVTQADNSGTTGDLSMVLVQGEWLHVAERAFRARMFNPVRGRIQCAGRKMGHAHEYGAIKGGLLDYVVNLDRLNKGESV